MELPLCLLRPPPRASVFPFNIHFSFPETLLGMQTWRPAQARAQDTDSTYRLRPALGGPHQVEEAEAWAFATGVTSR